MKSLSWHNPLLILPIIFGSSWLFLTRGWDLTDIFFPVPLIVIVFFVYYSFASFAYNALKIRTFLELTLVSLFLWSSCTYFVGRMAQLNSVVICTVLALSFLPEILSKFQFFRFIFSKTVSNFEDNSKMKYWLIFIGVMVLGITWIKGPYSSALLPDTTCDGSLAHLILPKHYIQNEAIFNVWWTRAPFLSQFIHFLYLFPMKLGLSLELRYDLIPHIFSTFFLLIILSIFSIATQSLVIALAATVLFMSTPVVSLSLGIAYLDLPATMMFLYSLYYFYKFSVTNDPFYLGYLGFSLGLSFATKSMLGMLLFPVGLIFFTHIWIEYKKEYSLSILLRRTFQFSLACILPILVFYEYNWELTGNPIFPFLYRPIPNPYFWDMDTFKEFNGAIGHWAGSPNLLSYIKLFTKMFSWNLSEHTDTINSNLTPLLTFAIIGPFFLIWFKKISLRAFLIYLSIIVAYYTTWYASSAIVRYLIPLVGLFCITLAYSLFKSRVVLILFLVLMSTNLFKLIGTYDFLSKNAAPPSSKEQAEEYLFANSFLGKSSKWLLKNSDPSDLVYTYKVSCEWLRIPRPFLGDWFGHSNYGEFISYSKNNRFIEFFNERNISFIFDTAANGMPSVPELAGSANACIAEVIDASNENVKLYKFNKNLAECTKVLQKPEINEIIDRAPKTLL